MPPDVARVNSSSLNSQTGGERTLSKRLSSLRGFNPVC
jgi:hypothetical protein